MIKHKLASIWGKFGIRLPGIWAPILCYHSINNIPNQECDPLSVQLFEKHLLHLKSEYDVISVDDLVAGIYGGGFLPKRPVAITFDDGYVDNYMYAFPLLVKYGLPATFFLATDFISGKVRLTEANGWEAMTWGQILEMQKSSLISFGAHTRTHPILSELEDAQAYEEIDGSREDIMQHLGIKAKTFAYPNGQGADIPVSALKVVEELRFIAAFSTIWSTYHLPEGRWLIPRVMISGTDEVSVLERKLCGDYNYLYYWHKLKALTVKFSGSPTVFL